MRSHDLMILDPNSVLDLSLRHAFVGSVQQHSSLSLFIFSTVFVGNREANQGLNDVYAGVRSQIMLIEPLSNMSKVFSFVNQEERKLYSQESDAEAMAVVA
ncbi:hypothetical protein Lal_00012807 [Lupinus albus]|nr:hypothetical protein Lal_00012807 [Lupinus albus]